LDKLFKILFVFFAAIIFGGCTNAVAVHKLNNAAKEYLENNDYKNAISRLESSVELDYKQYQARYMLASAYLKINDCSRALEQALFIADLRPQEPVVYSIKGDAHYCICKDILNNELTNKKTNTLNTQNQKSLKRYLYNLKKANEAYDKYTDLAPNAEDANGIIFRINENKKDISSMEQYIKQ